jgi:FkbM family methyltransferase
MIRKIAEKVKAYWREVRYVLRASVDVDTCIRLSWETARFHVANKYGSRGSATQFKVKVRLSRNYNAEIHLRTFSGDLFVLFEVLCDNVYNIPESILPPNTVRVILDCGGNVGITALYLASKYPDARIYSIEPDAENFALLSSNTKCEPRIIPIRAAVVGRPASNVRFTKGAQAWANKVSGNEEGECVPAVTIAEICARWNLPHVDLLKMDIEGAEREVFKEGRFLDCVSFVIAELHPGYSDADFAVDMAGHGLIAAAAGSMAGIRMTTASRESFESL